MEADVLGQGGRLSPGIECGVGVIANLTVTGSLDFTEGGVLWSELAKDATESDSDRVSFTGDAALGGVLSASFLEGGDDVTPWLLDGTPGDAFIVLTAGGELTGKFDFESLPDVNAMNLPELEPGHIYEWKVIYDRNNVPDESLANTAAQTWVNNGTRDVVLVIAETTDPDIVNTGASLVAAGEIVSAYRIDGMPVGSFDVALYLSGNGLSIDTPDEPLAVVEATGLSLGAHTLTLSAPTAVVPSGTSLIILQDRLLDEEEEPELVPGGAIEEASEGNNLLVIHEPQIEAPTADEQAEYVRFLVNIPATYKPVSLNYETAADVNAEHAATEGTDFSGVSGTLVFAVGETSKFIDVPLIAA